MANVIYGGQVNMEFFIIDLTMIFGGLKSVGAWRAEGDGFILASWQISLEIQYE